ncbi:MAG TPA: hypothetical protein VI756_15415 [Blastocatellia bacterium]
MGLLILELVKHSLRARESDKKEDKALARDVGRLEGASYTDVIRDLMARCKELEEKNDTTQSERLEECQQEVARLRTLLAAPNPK